MGNTTRFPNGVTNSAQGSLFGEMGQLDPTQYHTYFNDFDTFTSTQWTITTVEAGAGSATEAITNADGGILVITNDAADDDSDFLQLANETFKFASGKQLWFRARFKVSDATQSDVVMGLQITDTTPLAVTDGVYFIKADGAATVDFKVVKDSTATTTSSVATLANDTYVTLGFYYDGASTIYIEVDGSLVYSSVTTNLPDDEDMTISFGIQNGEAVAKVLSIDYLFVAKQRD